MSENNSGVSWQVRMLTLLSILFLAGFLRLVNLEQSPPGLNQDGAANAWNAYCLLKTGTDQAGEPWPVFYTRGLGGNRTTLYIYLLLPFQAIGGLNIYTTRLPAAVGGIVTVFLIYFVGKRLFGWKIGMAAAGFLALNPWHIQQSRWGHEASLSALYGILPLAALLWANLPITDDKTHPPRPARAALAGALIGICCYGYHAMRVFIPVFLLVFGLITIRKWWHLAGTRKGLLAIAAFVVAFGAVFGPLVFMHMTNADEIAKRVEATSLWNEADPIAQRVQSVLARYAGHFGLDFLFVHGDRYFNQSPPGAGQFHWYMLPLMVLGLITLAGWWKRSYGARILLVCVLVYPAGDCFSRHAGMHALRSLPGLCALVLLAAVGAVGFCRWLWKDNKKPALVIIAVFITFVIAINACYLHRFYGRFNRDPLIYHSFHVDLIEACRWLKPHLDNVDAVFCTTDGMNQPYVTTLVILGHDPERWFSQERVFRSQRDFDICKRYGKIHFMYDRSAMSELTNLRNNGKQDRVVFIVRPGELGLKGPVHEISRPDGEVTLQLYEDTF